MRMDAESTSVAASSMMETILYCASSQTSLEWAVSISFHRPERESVPSSKHLGNNELSSSPTLRQKVMRSHWLPMAAGSGLKPASLLHWAARLFICLPMHDRSL